MEYHERIYLWCELVSDESSGIRINILSILLPVLILPRAGGLCNLEEGGGGSDVADLEPREVDPVHVRLRGAEVIFCHPV